MTARLGRVATPPACAARLLQLDLTVDVATAGVDCAPETGSVVHLVEQMLGIGCPAACIAAGAWGSPRPRC